MAFTVYIDESGDEGFAFNSGSSEWFVLSAVIVPSDNDPCVALARGIRDALGKPKDYTLHFKDLRHEQRVVLCSQIAESSGLVASSVLVHKPSLKNMTSLRQKNRLYFYFSRFLLERVSWYCRDNCQPGCPEADVIFEHRASITYGDLRGYLETLQADRSVSICWDAIDPERVRPLPKKQRAGLQLADAIAGSLTSACELNGYGFTEDRYARMIEPVTYRRHGEAYKYGLKVFPKSVYELIDEGLPLGWAEEAYDLRR